MLQGGGALGAYQAGAFQTLAEGGFDVDWIAAISIGAPLQYVVENAGADLLCTFSDRRRPREQIRRHCGRQWGGITVVSHGWYMERTVRHGWLTCCQNAVTPVLMNR